MQVCIEGTKDLHETYRSLAKLQIRNAQLLEVIQEIAESTERLARKLLYKPSSDEPSEMTPAQVAKMACHVHKRIMKLANQGANKSAIRKKIKRGSKLDYIIDYNLNVLSEGFSLHHIDDNCTCHKLHYKRKRFLKKDENYEDEKKALINQPDESFKSVEPMREATKFDSNMSTHQEIRQKPRHESSFIAPNLSYID